jgi:hypothetical protein
VFQAIQGAAIDSLPRAHHDTTDDFGESLGTINRRQHPQHHLSYQTNSLLGTQRINVERTFPNADSFLVTHGKESEKVPPVESKKKLHFIIIIPIHF